MKNFILFSFFVFTTLACTQTTDPLKKLETDVQAVFSATEGDFAMAFLDLDNPKNQILINADEQYHAASTMKTPVMIEIYKQVAEGKFNVDDSIMVKNEFKSIVDGSPYMMDISDDSQEGLYNMIGKKSTIYDLMYEMITLSSNLATNILIELVDAKKVTATMRDLGAAKIEVLRGVEDMKAYNAGLSNSTTARDLMVIMQAIAQSKAGSAEDCEKMISILKDQKWNDIIPNLLPEDVQVAHKTGSITALHHDSGIVYLPDGRSYILILLSKNLGDFDEGTEKLAEVSKMVYDFVVSP